MRRRSLLALSGLCLMLGCSAPEPPADAKGRAGSADFGRVTVQVVPSSRGSEIKAQALFVRWRGLEGQDVGALLALPGLGAAELKPGECKLFDQAAAMEGAAGGRSDIQLLDAGSIRVQTSSEAFALDPQRYPDLLPNLSGFEYRGGGAGPVAPSTPIAVESMGGEEIGDFTATVRLPAPIEIMSVAGSAPGPGLAVRRGVDLPVRTSPGEDTYVELQAASADGKRTQRCRPEANIVTLPDASLGELGASEATLSAVRWVSVPLRAASGDRRGELWVELRDQIPVALR